VILACWRTGVRYPTMITTVPFWYMSQEMVFETLTSVRTASIFISFVLDCIPKIDGLRRLSVSSREKMARS